MATSLAGLLFSGTAAAESGTQFEVQNGAIEPATGTPMPASGLHATLFTNASAATTTIEGGGQVIVGAMGDWCAGMPIIRVTVDGVVAGSVRLASATTYAAYTGGRSFGPGQHVVRIVMTNDHVTQSCDRNAHLAFARMQNPGPPPPPPPPSQPGPDNTGVPAGTVLDPYYGDITITQDGTVLDSLDIHGFVDVQADNVTISRSMIRGRDPGTVNRSLVAAHREHVNLVIVDSTLQGAYPTPYLDGLKGYNFTAVRVDISRVIDTVMILGDNATVRDSWLHDTAHFSPDPRQSDNRSHDDSVQIEGGRNIALVNNTMEDAHNAAVMITQNAGVSGNISILSNFISEGACSINIAEKGRGPIQNVTVGQNVFWPPQYAGCAVKVSHSSLPNMVGNRWADTGATVTVTWAD